MTNEIPEGCLPFDLEKVKNGAEVVFYDQGVIKEAKYLFFDDLESKFKSRCLLFVIRNEENWEAVWSDSSGRNGSYCKFYIKKKTKTYYTCVLKCPNGDVVFSYKMDSIEEAEDYKKRHSDCVKIISFELDDNDIEQKPKTKTLWMSIEKEPEIFDSYSRYETSSAIDKDLHYSNFSSDKFWNVQVEVPCE